MKDDFARRQGIYYSTIEEAENALIKKTLEMTLGNQLKAAKLLGINRNTLRSKIRKLGIEVNKCRC